MPLFGGSSPFDQDVEKVTSEANKSEDWGLILDICDRVSGQPQAAKDVLKSIIKRVRSPQSQVCMQALTLLGACVSNCGKMFHLEICSRDFMTEARNVVSKGTSQVSEKMRGLVKEWAEEFKNDPQLNLMVQLYDSLKAEGYDFPSTNPPASQGSNFLNSKSFLHQVTPRPLSNSPASATYPIAYLSMETSTSTIKKCTLQLLGICARLTHKHQSPPSVMHELTSLADEIDSLLENIQEQQRKSQLQIASLSKTNWTLTQEMKALQEKLASMSKELKSSQDSFRALCGDNCSDPSETEKDILPDNASTPSTSLETSQELF